MTRGDRRASSRGQRLYQRLLRLLPRDFRGDFGDSMARDFADRDDEVTGAARGRLWVRELPALLGTIGVQWAEAAWRDARLTCRMMARSPGFTLAAVLMLALGTGANAAIFSVIDAVLLRPAAMDPARIAEVAEQGADRIPVRWTPYTHVGVLARAPQFSAVAAIGGALPIMTGVGAPHRVDVGCVSASLFPLMGVAPAVGRVFTPAEDRAGAEPVVVLSYLEWQHDFGGDQGVVGRAITLNGISNTVIGIMPALFLGPFENQIDLWAPLGPAIGRQGPAGCQGADGTFDVVARVRAPLTLDQAATAVNASGLLAGLTTSRGRPDPHVLLSRTDQYTTGRLRTPFEVLLAAVGCVLLIACANVANLQLERLLGRRRELAVRLALGATPGRLVRQTLVENLVVSVTGALTGLLAARLSLHAIVGLMPPAGHAIGSGIPHVAEIAINGRTLAITLTAALLSGLAVGLLPALQAVRPGVADDLGQSSRTVAGGTAWVRRGLVMLEVALSVVLVVSAGLMIRTFLILRPVDPGFATTNRTIAEILFDGPWRVDSDRRRTVDAVLAHVGALPGVAAVSASSYLPLSGVTDLTRVTIGATFADVWSSWTTPGYFSDMGMQLVGGRLFTNADTASAPPVALVNEAMAERFWPGRNPLGTVVEVRAPDHSLVRRTIVGILRTTRSWGTDLEQRSELYMPYEQQPGSTLIYVVVRTTGAPPVTLASDIARVVADARPNQLVHSIESMQSKVDRSIAAPRFAMWLFGTFAAMGAVLAALGLAAVMSWWVTDRRREIGVRMALGASVERVAMLVLGEGLLLAASGLVAGFGVAILVARLLRNWLYGVAAPTDARTLLSCAVGMMAVAAFSAYLPARRAAQIDPTIALRSE